jgi:glycosyltransferase involved in cell wall biosynthesis
MPVFEVGLLQAGTVSVIIPACNVERLIRRALNSVFAQTHPADQVIVVDDGSSDKTREIVALEYGDRVTLIEQASGGKSKALNAGLRLATGEFIGFLEAADYWEPHKIKRQLHALAERPEAIANFTGLMVMDDDGRCLTELEPADPATLRQMLRWCNPNILSSSMLVRRSALEKLPFAFDQRQRGSEDWNLWYRLILQGPFCACPEYLTCYTAEADGLSGNADHMYNDFMKMLDSLLIADLHGLRRAIWRRRITSYQSFKACLTARAAGDRLREREYMMRSVADWPSPFWAPERFRYFAVTTMRS